MLTEEIKAKLRELIKDDEWKRNHSMGKQQMKIVDMYEKLLDDGHTISCTTVHCLNKRDKNCRI